MGEVKEYTFEELCRIVGDVAARHVMIRVYLFGSRARDDNTEGSDYDFCILTPDDYSLFDVRGFYADLRDTFGTDIEVECEESLRDDFGREVLRDRRLLYEA